MRLFKSLGCGKCWCWLLKPIRACCVLGSALFSVAPPRGGCAMAPRDFGVCWKQLTMYLTRTSSIQSVHYSHPDRPRYPSLAPRRQHPRPRGFNPAHDLFSSCKPSHMSPCASRTLVHSPRAEHYQHAVLERLRSGTNSERISRTSVLYNKIRE